LNNSPLLIARNLTSERRAGMFGERVQFRLEADFAFHEPGVVGVLGTNGAGKTTLFDLLSGAEAPTSGQVLCSGRDVHRVHPARRGRLVNHRKQRHHTRGVTGSFWNAFRVGRGPLTWMQSYERVNSVSPAVHLFDEPDLQDGYLGLLLNFIRELRARDHLVLISAHPIEPMHVQVIRNLCDSYLFVDAGKVETMPDFDTLGADERVQLYLGDLLADEADQSPAGRVAAHH
jgi:ABC-type multidrug transport system ATPase subunit